MMAESKGCERKQQLLQDLLYVLSRTSRTRAEIPSQSALSEPSLDDMLRRAIDEQRQAVRALEDHQHEHGC